MNDAERERAHEIHDDAGKRLEAWSQATIGMCHAIGLPPLTAYATVTHLLLAKYADLVARYKNADAGLDEEINALVDYVADRRKLMAQAAAKEKTNARRREKNRKRH